MTEEIKQNNMCCLTKGIMGIGKAVPQDSMHTDQGTSSLNPYKYKISVEKSYTGYAPFPPKLGWTLPLTF